jgi:hypothetical protein
MSTLLVLGHLRRSVDRALSRGDLENIPSIYLSICFCFQKANVIFLVKLHAILAADLHQLANYKPK